jgi:hypothetical protein
VTASAVVCGDRRPVASGAARLGAALDRPRLWRVTAALAALLLAAVIAVAAQGSMTVIARAPAGRDIAWARWCGHGQVRLDRRRLAFCARVNGIVLATTHGPAVGEIHLAVVGGFHLTLVRLPDGSRTPGIGARVTAIGPLLRARDGQREVQAFHWGPT